MLDASRYEHVIVDRYQFRGFHGCRTWCRLELRRLTDGRCLVIATEVKDNPGTSVTNCAEELAYLVCVEFGLDPSALVWIEYYDYPGANNPTQPRTYDLVSFDILPAGHDAVFANPRWRPMCPADWQDLGLPPRM